jgi:hypothetical protein
MSRHRVPDGPPLGDAAKLAGCRVLLVCAACTWSKSYSPARLIGRLKELKRGDERTAVGAVAEWVQWPCPACRRMRWASRVMLLGKGWVNEQDAQKLAVRNVRS